MIEPDLFVLSEEYSDWDESNRSIDLLALDRDGRVVVAELKRDAGAFMDLQAIRYAALVAHMTLDQAVAAHERYLQRRGMKADARQRIMEHLGGEGGDEPDIESRQPRILLVARDFPQELTTSVLWLNQAGLDIRCVRLLPYRLGGDLVLDVTQVIPLPAAEHYMIRIRDREAEQESRTYSDRAWTREEMNASPTCSLTNSISGYSTPVQRHPGSGSRSRTSGRAGASSNRRGGRSRGSAAVL